MRMIDVDALGVGKCSKDVLPEAYCAGWNGLIDLIEKAPTIDAVPVVRCRECKHRGTDDCIFHIKGEPADEELLLKLDNDFCSYGERKGGAE